MRRLLADAGGPLPMPPDVAARLAGVLDDLERDRAAESTSAGGAVPLRVRRRWPKLLLAAAAVVVGGYSVGTLALQGTLSGSDESSASGEAEVALDAGAGGAAEDDRAPQSAPGSTSGSLTDRRNALRLRSDALEPGVRRALRVLDGSAAAADGRAELLTQRSGCPGPGSPARSVRVRYDGEPAVLVAGRERRGEVLVTVYDCSGTELVRTRVGR